MTEPRIACLGEAMVELRETGHAADEFRLGYAGDCFNTAVNLARLGLPTTFVSLLGPDRFSAGIAAAARAAGLKDEGLLRAGSGQPGLYLIQTDHSGERHFDYWRGQSIARALFCDPARVSQLRAVLRERDWLYLSGITLAVMMLPASRMFWSLLEELAGYGLRIAFDPNWRPALWPDADTARDACQRMLGLASWSFPTLADEQALWHLNGAEEVLDFHAQLGVHNVILKCPQARAVNRAGNEDIWVQSEYAGAVVDTTGAGDAFNAGYMASRLSGATAESALHRAHAQAALTLAHHGAIAPG